MTDEQKTPDLAILDAIEAYMNEHGAKEGFRLLTRAVAVFSIIWSENPEGLIDEVAAHAKLMVPSLDDVDKVTSQ